MPVAVVVSLLRHSPELPSSSPTQLISAEQETRSEQASDSPAYLSHPGARACMRAEAERVTPCREASLCTVGLLRADRLPDAFWRAAPMHLASVNNSESPVPGLHRQTGARADGNSVCVMLEAELLPAPSSSAAKISDLPCLTEPRRCNDGKTV
ncbi:unnamed protein product [Pleuronectes platessa]|uniref:Uncharacterized protein n=1 Tax=Pleuronectes platessa TaxID=8262 RepID=A0A9N7TJ32_PLEPL|nr:unnamed protein product [Pleuronectes platessa]